MNAHSSPFTTGGTPHGTSRRTRVTRERPTRSSSITSATASASAPAVGSRPRTRARRRRTRAPASGLLGFPHGGDHVVARLIGGNLALQAGGQLHVHHVAEARVPRLEDGGHDVGEVLSLAP